MAPGGGGQVGQAAAHGGANHADPVSLSYCGAPAAGWRTLCEPRGQKCQRDALTSGLPPSPSRISALGPDREAVSVRNCNRPGSAARAATVLTQAVLAKLPDTEQLACRLLQNQQQAMAQRKAEVGTNRGEA